MNTVIYSYASIVLGIISLLIPVLLLFKKKKSAILTLASMATCTVSLVIQFWYLSYCASVGDVSSYLDTIIVLSYIVTLLTAGVIILNLVVLFLKWRVNS